MANSVIDRKTGEILSITMDKFDNSKHRLVYHSSKPSKTKQEFKDECDLNVMIKRFGAAGLLQRNSQNVQRPNLGDVTKLPQDYQEVLMKSAVVKQNFALLPAVEREKFGNDAGKYMDSLYEAEIKALEASSTQTGGSVAPVTEAPAGASNPPTETPQ